MSRGPCGLSITVAYNVSDQWNRAEIKAVVDGVTSIKQTLHDLGHHVSLLRVNDGIGPMLQRLEAEKPDLVFNLCEGYDERSSGEYCVAAVLELAGIPYTGSGPLALGLALEKPLAKQLFAAAGMLTPEFTVYSPGGAGTPPARYPVILKLAAEDASLSITRDNVVHDEPAFLKRLNELLFENHTRVLAEEFIDGREFTVALFNGEPIALEEIEFAIEPRILCFRAKWAEGSLEDVGTKAMFEPAVSDALRDEMYTLARRAWKLIGVRDYGRVDFRMDAEGRIYVLEVNPNPDITPKSGYRASLDAADISFPDFISRLIATTLNRSVDSSATAPAAVRRQPIAARQTADGRRSRSLERRGKAAGLALTRVKG